MMKDLNTKGCKFAADIVPYMYGELTSPASSVFESHLSDCTDCVDEFAAISAARYEVYDWKTLEFDRLPTPMFAIPFGEAERQASWIEKLRVAFGRPWAVPTMAFAALAVISAFGAAVYLSSSDDARVARTNANTRPLMEPRVEVEIPFAAEQPRLVTQEDPAPSARTKSRSAKPTSTRAVRSNRSIRRLEAAHAVEIRKPVITGRRVPRLNEFNDDEDTSLRLAQLFDDIDTRDRP